jgi:hypothetical protein
VRSGFSAANLAAPKRKLAERRFDFIAVRAATFGGVKAQRWSSNLRVGSALSWSTPAPSPSRESIQWSFWVMTEVEKPALAVLLHRFFLPEDQRDSKLADPPGSWKARRTASRGPVSYPVV